jgi:DNA-binding LacI/PurR family transcriptional regulator
MVVKPDSEADQDVQRLAQRIWQWQLSQGDEARRSLPAERLLAERFGVSRHAVRRSLKVLEEDGRLVRLSRRASVPALGVPGATATAAKPCRCLNFVLSTSLASEAIRWLVNDYMVGYNDALDELDLKTRHVTCRDQETDFGALLWQQVPYREQAVVILGQRLPALFAWLREQEVPFALQNSYAYDDAALPPHHGVFVNKVGGAFAGMAHLFSLGHRAIGFAGAADSRLSNTAVYDGYLAALKVNGLEARPEWCWPRDTNRFDQAVVMMREFLAARPLPTAFLTSNDFMALALCQAARERGLRVPEQLSVLGFNDQREAAPADPPLSTVRVPRRELARQAVDLALLAASQPQAPFQRRKLDCELVVRATTAPPLTMLQ